MKAFTGQFSKARLLLLGASDTWRPVLSDVECGISSSFELQLALASHTFLGQ